MIQSIDIKNFALVKAQKIFFLQGYSAFTGETGAGKSILFDAIDFLLGKKGDTKLIRQGAEKAIVEGEFLWESDEAKKILNSQNIDIEFPLIIRREFNNKGRSRAFINDTPTTLNTIKQLADEFLDLHVQHELLNLLKPSKQLQYLDEYAEITEKVESYKANFNKCNNLNKQLEDLQLRQAQNLKDKSYFEFLLDELEHAKITLGEEELIEQKLQLQEHAEEIKRSLVAVNDCINGDYNEAVYQQLNSLLHNLKKASVFFDPLKRLEDRLKSVLIELEDIANEAENLQTSVEFDEEEKEKLTERLNLINSLFTKHQVKNSTNLAAEHQSIADKINQFQGFENQITQLKQDISNLNTVLEGEANSISKIRKKSAIQFEKDILQFAQQLGLENAKINIAFQQKTQLSSTGTDDVEMLFSANQGQQPQPIQKVASGGEISRIMLSLKACLSGKNKLKTLLFDEVDAGVSGEVAIKFGKLFKQLGSSMQVICITHLPQVVAQAQQHYHVQKHQQNGETESYIKQLTEIERVEETAKIISGNKITPIAIENARQLLAN